MIDALLILFGGVLGSSHCIGMCGGFVLTVGAAQANLRANVYRQLVYSVGRVSVYALGGAMAGYVGWRLNGVLQPLMSAQAVLSLVAGGLLLIQGLAATGMFRLNGFWSNGSCLGARSFASLLTSTSFQHVFIAGALNGLLPCGLVYAYLALASSTGDMFRGLVVMALFGIGTVPVMILTGCGGTLLSVAVRRRVFQIAAWCLVVTGVLAMLRGIGFLRLEAPGCWLCGSA